MNKTLANIKNIGRLGRSTVDHLVRLETVIRKGLTHGQSSFYLKKVYDTTWKFGIMKDLHRIGIRGKLPL